MDKNILESFSREISEIPKKDQAKAMKDVVNVLSEDQKKDMSNALSGRPLDPDQSTSNKVWLIIIWCFGIVMLIAALVLSLSVFVPAAPEGTKSETILTVFMTVTAFLAGLFAPSPVQNKDGG